MLILALGLACAGALGLLLIQSGNDNDRILSDGVTLNNVEAFQDQVRRDLPIGTAKKDVEAYLTQWEVPHVFVDPSPGYGPLGNSFYGRLENIGMRFPFTADLIIRVYLNENDKVREIGFRLSYK